MAQAKVGALIHGHVLMGRDASGSFSDQLTVHGTDGLLKGQHPLHPTSAEASVTAHKPPVGAFKM